MKYLVRLFLFQVMALWFTSQLTPSLVVIGTWQTLLAAGAILALLMLIVRPLLKILFLPINFITFGLLSWLIDVAIVYLLTVVMPQVQIHPWIFPGLSLGGFIVPAIHLSYLWALVVSTMLISFIGNVLEFVTGDS